MSLYVTVSVGLSTFNFSIPGREARIAEDRGLKGREGRGSWEGNVPSPPARDLGNDVNSTRWHSGRTPATLLNKHTYALACVNIKLTSRPTQRLRNV